MFELLKRKSVVVSFILFGTLIGGSIGVYVRDNWDIKARVGLRTQLKKISSIIVVQSTISRNIMKLQLSTAVTRGHCFFDFRSGLLFHP